MVLRMPEENNKQMQNITPENLIPKESVEFSQKIVGLILLSLTDIDPSELKEKLKQLANELIKKWYKV